jgi:hypothetical protein
MATTLCGSAEMSAVDTQSAEVSAAIYQYAVSELGVYHVIYHHRSQS